MTEEQAAGLPSPLLPPPPVHVRSFTRYTSVVWLLAPAVGLALLVVVMNSAFGLLGVTLAKSVSREMKGLAFFVALAVSYGIQLLVVRAAAHRRGSTFAPAVGLNAFPIAAGISAALLASVVGRALGVLTDVALRSLRVPLPLPSRDPTQLLGSGRFSVVLIVLLLVVIAPFAEESVFRGVVQPALQRRFGDTPAIVLSGSMFALVHLQASIVVGVLFTGIALSWLAVRFRSIWPSIICHALFNGAAAVAIIYVRSR